MLKLSNWWPRNQYKTLVNPIISTHANGGPGIQVCPSQTLSSAPHQHDPKFFCECFCFPRLSDVPIYWCRVSVRLKPHPEYKGKSVCTICSAPNSFSVIEGWKAVKQRIDTKKHQDILPVSMGVLAHGFAHFWPSVWPPLTLSKKPKKTYPPRKHDGQCTYPIIMDNNRVLNGAKKVTIEIVPTFTSLWICVNLARFFLVRDGLYRNTCVSVFCPFSE